LSRLAVLLSAAVILSACMVDPGPPVDCQTVPAEDCRRAVEIARPLLGSDWDGASQVIVQIGACTRYMRCPPKVAMNQRFLTVELDTGESKTPYVVLDRGNAEWTASCNVLVSTGDGAHTEGC